jgi:L-arabinokinase
MSRPSKKIAYYITPHGFGHAVRSLEIVRILHSMAPGNEVTIVSDIPEFLVLQNLGHQVPYRRRRIDIGLVQQDSIQFDLAATLSALRALQTRSAETIGEESHFLRSNSFDLMVADIPFLPFRAANACGIPSIGIGNFTWDWIYSMYAERDPQWRTIIDWIREGYDRCELLLQLPMHGDCSSCPHRRDVPLVARKAKRSRLQTRKVLGIDPRRPAYLIAFGALDLDPSAQRSIQEISDALFLYKHPLHYTLKNGLCVDPFDLSYADVVAAVDAVITKPGYGIVSDCLAHGTPMVYSDRGPFPEYPILVETMQRELAVSFIPTEDLYSGRWETAIRAIQGMAPRKPALRTDGAELCARMILERMTEKG